MHPIPGKHGAISSPIRIMQSLTNLSYALNLKSLPYTTKWVELPDVKSTRLSLNVAPVRKLPNNEDFYTLPILHDPATSTYIGDSFDIAVYLDHQYPNSGTRLFPPGTIGVHRVFNTYVDALFTRHVILCSQGLGLFFNPETAEESKAEFVRRAGVREWSDLVVDPGDARRKMIEAFEREMEEFAGFYRDDSGPFLEGDKISYADVVVGGWLAFLKETLLEWEEVCGWQGGRWKRLHEGLAQWAEVK